jgi:hypothetical protein
MGVRDLTGVFTFDQRWAGAMGGTDPGLDEDDYGEAGMDPGPSLGELPVLRRRLEAALLHPSAAHAARGVLDEAECELRTPWPDRDRVAERLGWLAKILGAGGALVWAEGPLRRLADQLGPSGRALRDRLP